LLVDAIASAAADAADAGGAGLSLHTSPGGVIVAPRPLVSSTDELDANLQQTYDRPCQLLATTARIIANS